MKIIYYILYFIRELSDKLSNSIDGYFENQEDPRLCSIIGHAFKEGYPNKSKLECICGHTKIIVYDPFYRECEK